MVYFNTDEDRRNYCLIYTLLGMTSLQCMGAGWRRKRFVTRSVSSGRLLGHISRPQRGMAVFPSFAEDINIRVGCFSLLFFSLINVPWMLALSPVGLYGNLVQDGVSFNTVNCLNIVIPVYISEGILTGLTVTSRYLLPEHTSEPPVRWREISPARLKRSHESRFCEDQNVRESAFCQRCQRAKALSAESFEH